MCLIIPLKNKKGNIMNIRELINSMPVLAKALVLSAILGGAWACFSYLHWEHTPTSSNCECTGCSLYCCVACLDTDGEGDDCKCGGDCTCANCCPGN